MGRGLRPLPRPLPAPHHLTATTNSNPNPNPPAADWRPRGLPGVYLQLSLINFLFTVPVQWPGMIDSASSDFTVCIKGLNIGSFKMFRIEIDV